MLYSLFLSLVDTFSFLNVFKYLTVRTGLAMFTSMIIVFIIGNPFINFFSSKKIHDPIRKDGPEDHIVRKIGTPTMGGSFILIALLVSTLLWADLSNGFVWVVLFVTAGFGLIGFADDYRKLTRRSHHGVSGRIRLAV